MFTRFVEIGRVAMVNFGSNYGKLVVVVNVISPRWVLVDFADGSFERRKMCVTRLSLTDIKLPLQQGARPGTVAKAVKAADVAAIYAGSAERKKDAKQAARDSATDFDRFKIMVARKARSRAVRAKLGGGKAPAKKAGKA